MTAEGRESRANVAETTIVYVDDDPEAVDEVLGALREQLPAAAVRHVDGAARLLQSGLDNVDCLVSADQLVETAGVNLVRAVREVSGDIPVLLYGDPETPAEITAAFDAGATDYLQRVGDAAPTALARKVAAIVDANSQSDRTGEDAAGEVASPPTESLPAKEYRVIAEVASDAIVTIDERSRVHYANPAVEDVFGYDPEEIVGEPLTTLMPDEMVDPHLEGLGRYLETGERALDWSYLELPGECKDGTEIPLSVSFGEFERDGRTFFSGIMRDVSERRALEEELREERNLNRQIVETSPVGIMIADRDGAITFVNEHAERILGMDPESIESVSASVSELDVVGTDGEALPEDEMPFTRVLETGETVYEVEIGLRRPDGERVWVLMNAAPMLDADGEIADVVFAFQDVTERRQLAGELREVYGRVTDAFYALDEQWRITHANDRAEELIDYQGEGLVGKRIWDVFEWAEDSRIGEEYREAMATQEPTSFELYYPDPLNAWYEINAYPSETGLSVYFRDVTERKERERELELFRTLLDNTTDSILVIDPQTGEFLDANETACRQLGYDRDELIGLPVHEIDRVFDGIDDWNTHVEDVKDSDGVTIEGVHERKDGTTYPAEVNVTHVELDREYMVAVARDISERKERERELEESRHRYRTLIENFPNGAVALVDQSMRYVTFGGTPEIESLTSEEIEGEYLHDALPDELADAVTPGYEAALDGETVRYEETVDGGIYQFHFIPVRDDEGDVFTAIGMSQNVTERKQRERALSERERQLQRHTQYTDDVLDAVDDVFYVLDEDGEFQRWNESLCEVTGYSDAELESIRSSDLFREEDRERIERAIAECFETGSIQIEVPFLTKSGETIPYEFIATRLEDPDGEPVIAGIGRDITEQRRRESELQEERDLNRHIVDTSPVGIVRLDADGVVRNANDRAEEILHHPADKVDDIDERIDTLDPVLPNGEPIPADELPTRRVAVEGEELRDFEVSVLNPAGDRIWLSMSGTPLRDDAGEVAGAVVTFADVTDRKLREAALEEYAQQQRTLSQLRRQALEGEDLDELFEATVERVADVLDHEYAKVLEIEEGGEKLFLRSGVGWHEGIVGAATVDTRENSQAGYTLQQSEPVVVEELDEETRFTGPELLTTHDVSGGISVIIGPRDNPWGVLGTHTTGRRTYDDHEVEFVQHVADLLATAIERKRHDHQIAALSDVTRVLMEVESPEAVCDIVVDAADGNLELPIASVALYDETDGRLRPAAATTLGEQLFAETELFEVASGLAWDAFVNDERRTDAPDRRVELPAEPVHLRERVALPLGKHGVLLVGIAGEGTMPDPQLDFVETVAATVRAALDRAEREATLRDREAALQRQNQDLERLARLNEVVRGIEQVLVGASTRSEIESAVCEQLATVEPYELAWIGQPDTASGDLRRIAAAGDTGYLDDADPAASPDDDPEPSLAAADTGEVRVAERVHTEPPLSGWRQAALRHGFSSAVGVPIEYGGYRYGVLTVYGDRTALFEERERETLVDLGDTIAYAINAVESKRALVGDEVVELELELYDPDAFVFQFLAECGGRFEFENVFLQDGRGLRTLFSAVDVTSEEIHDYAERSPFVEELRRITDDDPPLFECTLTEDGFIPRLFDHGARPQQLSATAEGAQLVVELPATVDVRGFVEMLQTLFEDVELLARRERTLETRSRREFQAELDAELTDRQREVLRTAYFGGFFETPRRRTGKEIGESLDISQPTFNHHLRAAQRKLFELLYGSADPGAESA